MADSISIDEEQFGVVRGVRSPRPLECASDDSRKPEHSARRNIQLDRHPKSRERMQGWSHRECGSAARPTAPVAGAVPPTPVVPPPPAAELLVVEPAPPHFPLGVVEALLQPAAVRSHSEATHLTPRANIRDRTRFAFGFGGPIDVSLICPLCASARRQSNQNSAASPFSSKLINSCARVIGSRELRPRGGRPVLFGSVRRGYPLSKSNVAVTAIAASRRVGRPWIEW